MAYTLDWTNLLLDRCPSCGELFDKAGDDFICRNHQGQPFKISGFRFAQIVHDLEQRDDMRHIREF